MADQSSVTLPDPQTAYNNLHEHVRNRVIFQKMAAAGFPVTNQQQAQAVLTTIERLKQANAHHGTDSQDFFSQADAMLSRVMAERYPQVKQASDDQQLLAIAEKLASDAGLYNSVVALRLAEAEEIRQQLLQQQGQA